MTQAVEWKSMVWTGNWRDLCLSESPLINSTRWITNLVQQVSEAQNTFHLRILILKPANRPTVFCGKFRVQPHICHLPCTCEFSLCLWPIWTSLPTIRNKNIHDMQLPINDFVQPMRFTVSDTVVIWQKIESNAPWNTLLWSVGGDGGGVKSSPIFVRIQWQMAPVFVWKNVTNW